MTNKVYDTMKFISLLIAPIVVFCTALVQIWGISHGAEVVATLGAIDVLFGAIVVIAKKKHDGKMEEE